MEKNEEIKKQYFDNRELSWLKFNQRVLEEAQDVSVPLFERLLFVSIFQTNLDEFFMIRVGTLHDQTLLKSNKFDNKTNMTASEQLAAIAAKTKALLPEKDLAYESIMRELSAFGIEQVDLSALSQEDDEFLEDYFMREILPLLSPTVIDKNHPLPFLKNKEVYVGVVLHKKESEKGGNVIGILPVTATGIFERLIILPSESGTRFVLAEDLILHFADLAFKHFDIINRNVFRITRNADIDVNEALYDHDVDFRDVMEEVIKKRKKLAPVRIEIYHSENEVDYGYLAKVLGLELGGDFVFVQSCPLDLSYIFTLRERESNPELVFVPYTPQYPLCLNPSEPIIKQIERGDKLLFYPYEEFRPFITLLEQASTDPTVVSIKITLYRVARDSKIVNALIAAAENGKDVLALVELRARFDEENNIGWSKRLAEAGVTVIYGLDELKVHSKLLLITKKQGNEIKYITQIGTGNYNERTSKLYTDLTLMTSDKEIGADASLVFNNLSIGTTVESSSVLWVAPNCLKSRVVEMIDREITYGADGYIGLKLNSLTDRDIIEKLVQANQKGVKTQLIIRGICCLIAGIPGYTDNITVTSIVGRFLEHSRIYIFGKGERQKVFISSADFMTRNTERRVEVAAPVKDPEIKKRLVMLFEIILSDNVKARIQQPDGSYIRKNRAEGEQALDTQEYFCVASKKQAFRPEKKKSLLDRIKAVFGRKSS